MQLRIASNLLLHGLVAKTNKVYDLLMIGCAIPAMHIYILDVIVYDGTIQEGINMLNGIAVISKFLV